MANNLIHYDFEHSRTIGIRRSKICETKKLATHCLNLGLLCGNNCYYCSTPSLVQTHNVFKDLKTSSFNIFEQGIGIFDPSTPEKVKRESHRLTSKDTVLLSTLTDPYAVEVERRKLARQCLEHIIHNSKASIRISTKNAGILSDFDLLTANLKRVQIAMNITAPLSKQTVIRYLEPEAAPIEYRLHVLKEAQKRKIPIYGMFSPCIPGILSTKEDIEEIFETILPFNPTGIWVEPLNPRDRNISRCVDALRANSEDKVAGLVDSITDRSNYVDFVSNFVNTATKMAIKYKYLDKLNIMVYGHGDSFNIDHRASVVWLKR